MARQYHSIAYTDSVIAAQEKYGSRHAAERMASLDIDDTRLTDREIGFIARMDGFYMATVSQSGRPYVQFRGGQRGFLKTLDERTLAYADFRGNRQYLSTGNLAHDDHAALILMDYARQQRLKVMARAEVIDPSQRPDLLDRLAAPGYRAKIERIVVFRVEAFDWNCPQHITPRFTEEEIAHRQESLLQRIAQLEAENAALRSQAHPAAEAAVPG